MLKKIGALSPIRLFILFTITLSALPFQMNAQQSESARDLLEKSLNAIHLPADTNLVFDYVSADSRQEEYQSDRTYPPYFSLFSNRETRYYPLRNIEAVDTRIVFPSYSPKRATHALVTPQGSYIKRQDNWVPVPSKAAGDLNLNPIAVLKKWKAYQKVRTAGKKVYRDFPRLVLEHSVKGDTEYLYLDPESYLPVKYEKTISHYLWGSRKVEYLYSTWMLAGHTYFPGASFKILDGNVQISRTHGKMAFASRDTLDALTIPREAVDESALTAIQKPDTIRIGHNLYMLKNRFYNELVALIDNTVYIFDATQAEERAMLDHEWIRKLFPGDHPVALVVTDLAWPHIGGVRYWVSQDASVYAHSTSEAFLHSVINRRWNRHPDRLEKIRDRVSFRFTGVDQSLDLAGGKVQLFNIGGIGSEGALMVYLPGHHFLWASDYIQMTQRPTAYAGEVRDAVKRYHLKPQIFAAEHLEPTDWMVIEKLYKE